MVVDANAPDVLHPAGPDFGWLDEACQVKGDLLTLPDEDLEFEKESEDEVQLIDPSIKGKQRVSRSDLEEGSTEGSTWYPLHLQDDQVPGLPPQFSSDWNLGLDALGGTSSGRSRKRGHGSRQVGGSKIVKVKMPQVGTHPLAIDRRGRIKGAVALGSRQKLNAKN